jgi:protein-S-isoprenylcysteine O-methyltransferase Ste14
LTVPIWIVVLARIRKEEAALLEGLGSAYAGYCARTRRLVPGIY